MKNTIQIEVEWGDCDPAQIVFNANFFRWFDKGSRHLFQAASWDNESDERALRSVEMPAALRRRLTPTS